MYIYCKLIYSQLVGIQHSGITSYTEPSSSLYSCPLKHLESDACLIWHGVQGCVYSFGYHVKILIFLTYGWLVHNNNTITEH